MPGSAQNAHLRRTGPTMQNQEVQYVNKPVKTTTTRPRTPQGGWNIQNIEYDLENRQQTRATPPPDVYRTRITPRGGKSMNRKTIVSCSRTAPNTEYPPEKNDIEIERGWWTDYKSSKPHNNVPKIALKLNYLQRKYNKKFTLECYLISQRAYRGRYGHFIQFGIWIFIRVIEK